MKQIIAKLFGQRKKSQSIDFSAITSVLLKPIGDAVGDAIVHIVHLKQIKTAFPQIKIGVFVSPRNDVIFRQSGLVDMLFEDHYGTYFSQRRKWDLYLDFTPNYTSRSIILDALLQPKIVINFGKKEKKYYSLDKVKNYDFSVQPPDFTHIKDYLNYSPLAAFLPCDTVYYSLPRVQNEKINRHWAADRVRILLNPQGSNRQLPAQELSQLLSAIQPIFHSHIDLLLTNTSESKAYLSQLNSLITVRLAPQMNLLDYFALVDSADIVVAVDGGGIHTACAYGKPLLAFYANNVENYSRWAVNPQKSVNTLMLISKNTPTDNTETENFDIQAATTWLNDEIERQLSAEIRA